MRAALHLTLAVVLGTTVTFACGGTVSDGSRSEHPGVDAGAGGSAGAVTSAGGSAPFSSGGATSTGGRSSTGGRATTGGQATAGGAGGDPPRDSGADRISPPPDAPPPPPCDGDAAGCFCSDLVSCSERGAVEALPLGSRGYRICPTETGSCTVRYFLEMEGAVTVYRCGIADSTQCQADAWSHLVQDACPVAYRCNLLQGDCPPDLLDCDGRNASVLIPVCGSMAPDTYRDCDDALGFANDGTGCREIRGCPPLFDDWRFHTSRELCNVACKGTCDDVEAARTAFTEAARACTVDADCMWVESNGPPYDHCSCMVALNRSVDVGRWRELNLSYGCFEQAACCDAPPPPAVCREGHCAAGP